MKGERKTLVGFGREQCGVGTSTLVLRLLSWLGFFVFVFGDAIRAVC